MFTLNCFQKVCSRPIIYRRILLSLILYKASFSLVTLLINKGKTQGKRKGTKDLDKQTDIKTKEEMELLMAPDVFIAVVQNILSPQ